MLRVATFNVLFGHVETGPGSWSERLPLLRRAVEAARPDILGLQEVFPSKLDDIADLVAPMSLVAGPSTGPPRWAAVSLPIELILRSVWSRRFPRGPNGTTERMRAGEHQPIAYRADRFRLLESGGFWISSDLDRPGSMLPLAMSPFLVHWARLDALDGSGPVLVMNAHFGHNPWHHAATARIVAAQLSQLDGARDGGTSVAGDSMKRSSVFLVGDFNAQPSARLLKELTSARGAGFVDAARAAVERTGPGATYHWGTGSTRLGLTLDYVLARTALHPRRAEVIDVHDGRLYPSDHYLLVLEFGLSPSGSSS